MRPALAMDMTMDDQTQHAFLDGGAEEWLRRIALGRAPVTVPDTIAFALAAIGFAHKTAAGRLEATESGRAYLDARGIPVHRELASRKH